MIRVRVAAIVQDEIPDPNAVHHHRTNMIRVRVAATIPDHAEYRHRRTVPAGEGQRSGCSPTARRLLAVHRHLPQLPGRYQARPLFADVARKDEQSNRSSE